MTNANKFAEHSKCIVRNASLSQRCSSDVANYVSSVLISIISLVAFGYNISYEISPRKCSTYVKVFMSIVGV